jgi:hypothetical protein
MVVTARRLKSCGIHFRRAPEKFVEHRLRFRRDFLGGSSVPRRPIKAPLNPTSQGDQQTYGRGTK